MEKLFEFAANHYLLVSTFFGLLIALFITESRRGGMSISPLAVVNLVNKQDAKVIDVRPASDYESGHITGSINIPYTEVNSRLEELEKFKDNPIVLVCAIGQHAGTIGRQLHSKGFQSVYRLSGGIGNWQADKMPLVKGRKA